MNSHGKEVYQITGLNTVLKKDVNSGTEKYIIIEV